MTDWCTPNLNQYQLSAVKVVEVRSQQGLKNNGTRKSMVCTGGIGEQKWVKLPVTAAQCAQPPAA